jgi:hypothetical protein
MSQVRTNLISNVAGTNSPDITGGELSRARFQADGTGVAAFRDSFNMSSLTDNGVGRYTFNFATAFPNAQYAAIITSNGNASPTSGAQADCATHTPTTTSISFGADTLAGAAVDPGVIYGAFFGDRP